MIYQNRKELNKNIQKYGCYYVDLVNIYAEVAEHKIQYETVNAAYVMSTRVKNYAGVPYLGKDCYVNDVHGIGQILSGLVGIPVELFKVKEYEEYNFVIGYFKRVTNSGNIVGHFVELFHDKDIVKRDPWYPSSRTAKEGILKSKRYILTRRLA